MVATGLAYDARVRAAQAKVLARAIPQVRDIRRFGSAALDLCWTAAGGSTPTSSGRSSPGTSPRARSICERAGLSVLDLPEHEDLPYGILAAPAAIAGELLELVGEARDATGGARRWAGCDGWESNPHALADRGF